MRKVNLKEYFDTHYEKWVKNTRFMSSAYDIINDDDFKAIVSMGTSATPFIIEKIKKKASTLVWALNVIYGKKISNRKDLTVSEACRLWVKKMSEK